MSEGGRNKGEGAPRGILWRSPPRALGNFLTQPGAEPRKRVLPPYLRPPIYADPNAVALRTPPSTAPRAISRRTLKAVRPKPPGTRCAALKADLRAFKGMHSVGQTQVSRRFLNPRPVQLRSQCTGGTNGTKQRAGEGGTLGRRRAGPDRGKQAPRGEVFWVCGRVVAPWARSCARREARGRKSLSRCARGVWVIASNARFGPVPLKTLGRVTGLSHRGLSVHR